MNTTPTQARYARYTFRDKTGYVVAPWIDGAAHDWVAIRHSALVPPWIDGDVHLHTDAEEYFFVLRGGLSLLVSGSVLTLKPYEVLLVRPEVPHAVVGGKGPVEHFVLRMPAWDDRHSVSEVPAALPPAVEENDRALRRNWGCRVPLTEPRYQNCWLFGFGEACFRSNHICLAYLDLPTEESAEASWRRHPRLLHLHRESWEYYTVLAGKKTLEVANSEMEVNAGEILEIPPGVEHAARAIRTPYHGFTFRVPPREDKVLV